LTRVIGTIGIFGNVVLLAEEPILFCERRVLSQVIAPMKAN
jgi:hypothetical protein